LVDGGGDSVCLDAHEGGVHLVEALIPKLVRDELVEVSDVCGNGIHGAVHGINQRLWSHHAYVFLL
jgi:hypothetical protein